MRRLETATCHPRISLALKRLALLAPRPGELRLAKWDEFDFQEKNWRIPVERTKMRREHRVTLPDRALELLRELSLHRGKSEYLFQSIRMFHKPISENTLNQALRRMGYTKEQVTAHGFRASFSTIANESGLWNPDAIERALAHVEANDVRRAYLRGEHWDERTKMAEWWAGELDKYKKGG